MPLFLRSSFLILAAISLLATVGCVEREPFDWAEYRIEKPTDSKATASKSSSDAGDQMVQNFDPSKMPAMSFGSGATPMMPAGGNFGSGVMPNFAGPMPTGSFGSGSLPAFPAGGFGSGSVPMNFPVGQFGTGN